MTDLGLILLYYWILCLVALKNVRLLLFFYNFLYFCSLERKENNDNEQENDRYLAISNTGGIVMSMLLAIESNVGLGGFWIGCGNDEHNNSLLKLLGIPENMSLFGMIAFGVKDEYKEHNTAVINDKIHVNNW